MKLIFLAMVIYCWLVMSLEGIIESANKSRNKIASFHTATREQSHCFSSAACLLDRMENIKFPKNIFGSWKYSTYAIVNHIVSVSFDWISLSLSLCVCTTHTNVCASTQFTMHSEMRNCRRRILIFFHCFYFKGLQ